MADQIQTLLVSLEARLAGYEREMKRAVGISNKSAKSIETRFESMNRNLSNTAGQLGGILGKAFAGAAALRGAQVLIDTSTRIENSLKVAGLAGEDLTKVYDGLFASAQRNAAPIEDLVTLYSRASQSAADLGVSQSELLKFTDNVALSLRVGGKSAQEASGALLQLSQVLGGGIVQAEEYNSLIDGAQPLLQAVAAGLKEAGGSVSALTRLVKDGKVSSEAFFRAFEAGAGILETKVASSELTVSQGFVRLQNVLIDTAGKFDGATNGSSRLATGLQQLSGDIARFGEAAERNGPTIDRFLNFIGGASANFSNSVFAGTEREIQGIASAVDAVIGAFNRYGDSVTDAELATAAAEQALATFALNGGSQFGELEPVVQDFIQQLLEGKGTAEDAAIAIQAIGEAGDFGGLLGQLSTLVDGLFAVRSEAVATAAAVAAAQRGDTSVTNIAGQRAEQQGNRPKPEVKPVSLTDYKLPASGKGGGGGSKQSPGEKFSDVLAAQREENRLLAEKTALQATLNPLVNDYGLAVEKLNVQQELQSAATKAGLALTPELKATIDELATGYANASVEAARLAEAQDNARETSEAFISAGKSAFSGFISDLRNGVDAADALNNAMNKVLDSVIEIGLNAIFGGLTGGGGLFGGLGKLFGFADGGFTGQGGKNEPKGVVHGGEFVFSKKRVEQLGLGNLERLHRGYASGGYVGAPGPVGGRGAMTAQPAHIVLEVQEGAAFSARILEVSGPASAEIASRTVKRYDSDQGSRSAEKQARFG